MNPLEQKLLLIWVLVAFLFVILIKYCFYFLSKLGRYYQVQEQAIQLAEKKNRIKTLEKYKELNKCLALSDRLSMIPPSDYSVFKLKLSELSGKSDTSTVSALVKEFNKAPKEVKSCILELFQICDEIIAINNPVKHYILTFKKNQSLRKIVFSPVKPRKIGGKEVDTTSTYLVPSKKQGDISIFGAFAQGSV